MGGAAKTIIWHEKADGEFHSDAGEMVEMVRNKFGEQQQPKYIIKEISTSIISEKCAESHLKVLTHLMVQASSKL